MIIFSNSPLAKIIINEFKESHNITLVCDESAKELIDFARSENIATCEWTNFRAKPFWDNQWSVVFSFGHIIPEKIIVLFRHQIANIHPSLLPLYRGSSPLQSSILDGQIIGYTIIKLDKELDSGDILFQKEMRFENNNSYYEILNDIVADATRNLQKAFCSAPVKQDHSRATYCQKITHENLKITEKDDAKSAYAKIKCYFPSEKAYLVLAGRKFFIHQARLSGDSLEIITIQPEGKRIMDSKDFLNGYAKLLTTTPSFVKIA